MVQNILKKSVKDIFISKPLKKVKTQITIKKEFDMFAQKVAKLESLKHELNALDSKGFESDVRVINAKLKDVNAIPQIINEIKILRNKISKAREKNISNTKVLEKNLEKEHKEIKKKVSELEVTYKKQAKLTKEQINDIKDIPLLEGELNVLKRESASNVKSSYLKNKISDLQKVIAKKKKIKRQLSRDQVENIKGIPKLERQIKGLHKEFVKHTKASKKKIDAGIGVLVDTNFNDFISQIKAELTQRLKNKELIMDTQLKADMEAREKMLANKYRKLSKEFHDKYEAKIKNEFKIEVKKRFNSELNKKLVIERKKLIDALVKENIKRLSCEKEVIINEFHSKFLDKRKELNVLAQKYKEDYLNNLEKIKKKRSETRQNYLEKVRSLGKKDLKRESEYKFKEQKLKEQEKNFKQSYLDKINEFKLKEKRHEELNDNKLFKKVEELKLKMQEDVSKRVSESMKGKEDILRKKLDKEYRDKFNAKLNRKREELRKKKEALEKHVIAQAQKLFGN
jgi:hypothetical protein